MCRRKGQGVMFRVFILIVAVATALAVVAGSPKPAQAAMTAVSDEVLAAVTGQAGISVTMNIGAQVYAGTISISDSSSTPNWFELRGFTIDDGAGNPFPVKTPDDTPLTFDVATDASGRTMFVFNDSSMVGPRFYSAQSIVFAGQELGSLSVGPVSIGPSVLRVSSHAEGTEGLDFDYTTRIDIGAFSYAYNTASTFTASGIHLFQSATGNPSDDPSNPATWLNSGNFRVGDLSGGNPATFDVTTDSSGKSMTVLNLPMQGSLRVEDVSVGGTSFGPAAIDGINVHRLQLRLTP